MENLGNLKKKLMMQRAWNGSKDAEICKQNDLFQDEEIMEKVRE